MRACAQSWKIDGFGEHEERVRFFRSGNGAILEPGSKDSSGTRVELKCPFLDNRRLIATLLRRESSVVRTEGKISLERSRQSR